MRHLFYFILLSLTLGCTPSIDDLQVYTQNVRNSAVVSIEPYPEFTSQPSFQYEAQALRSPFLRAKSQTAPVVQARQENCIQPNFQRRREKLENYGLDALTMAGNFKSQGDEWALIRSNDGMLHKAKLGSRIGLFYGKIIDISAKSISIEQLLPDGAGCWQRKNTTLSTKSASGEQNND